MRRWRRWIGVFIALFALGLSAPSVLTGCGRVVNRKAEDRVNAILPSYLGKADRYETHLTSDGAGATLRGHLRHVHIDGWGVHLAPALIVDTLALDFDEVNVDARAGRLESIGSAAFACQVGASYLDNYVRTRRGDIPGLSVGVCGDRLVVNARPELLGLIGVPVSVEGTLLPRPGGAQLDFVPDAAHVARLRIPGLALDYLQRKLNPAIDLGGLRVPIQVSRAEVKDGSLTLTGSIAPDALMRVANPAPANNKAAAE